MKVGEFFGLIANSNMLRIEKDGRGIYTGYLGALLHSETEIYASVRDTEIKHFSAVPEITHKEWERLGLMKPLMPEETAQYSFRDLQMTLYYTIKI